MSRFLHRILERKALEVAELNLHASVPDHPLRARLEAHPVVPSRRFEAALKGAGLSVIAEVKRRSPSKGDLAEIADPLVLARAYADGGASAVSVLTDHEFFGGSLEDLRTVAAMGIPALRKDFLLHPLQFAEAAEAGASAVLLIVAAVGERTGELLGTAERLGLDVLVEVHDEAELETAVKAKARIIGVNNRNLETFEVDLATAEDLREKIPNGTVAVAESGIHSKADARRMADAGYDAVLVGEALVKSGDPAAAITAFRKAGAS